jgi:hypothetical protein
MNPWASPGDPQTGLHQTASAADTGALEVYRERQERVKFGRAYREKLMSFWGVKKNRELSLLVS